MNQIDKLIEQNNLNQYFIKDNHKLMFDEEKSTLFFNEFKYDSKLFFENFYQIKFLSDLVLEKYPFINNLNNNIIDVIIERNESIKKIIKESIRRRNAFEIKAHNLDYKDKTLLIKAKSIIKNLNNFIYKNKINKFWTDLIFLNVEKSIANFGYIECLCSNGKEYFLCMFKFSKSPYIEKYQYEVDLINKMLNKKFGVKVSKTLLFNIYAEQSVIEI